MTESDAWGSRYDEEFCRGSFYVTLHDVAPRFTGEIEAFVKALAPMIGRRMAAAVVPCWYGDPIDDGDQGFVDLVQQNFDQVLLHGFKHTREPGGGIVSRVSHGSDEFNGLTEEATDECLKEGQATLTRYFGKPAEGFLAPAYGRGKLNRDLLTAHGLRFLLGYRRLEFTEGGQIPLVTWIWDVGRIPGLADAAHFYANVRHRRHPEALPCVALHPADVEAGHVDHAVRVVRRLLDQGRAPVLVDNS